jgi:hypothetical protein
MVECTNCGRQWADGLAYCSACGGQNKQLPLSATPTNSTESADWALFGCALIAIIGIVFFINSASSPKKEQTQAEKDEETCYLVYRMTQRKPIGELTLEDADRIRACRSRGLYPPPGK